MKLSIDCLAEWFTRPGTELVKMIETLHDLRPLFEQQGIEGDWWRWAMPAMAQRVSGWNPAWLTTTEQILTNPTYVSQVALSALYDR